MDSKQKASVSVITQSNGGKNTTDTTQGVPVHGVFRTRHRNSAGLLVHNKAYALRKLADGRYLLRIVMIDGEYLDEQYEIIEYPQRLTGLMPASA